MTSSPPSALLRGMRAVIVDGATITSEPINVAGRWAFGVRIDIVAEGAASPMIPARSEWFAVVDPDYPFGSVGLYPSKTAGVTRTFEHQEINLPGGDAVPWRTGKICLDMPVRHLGLVASGNDPVGDLEGRLRWHLARAMAWTRAAAAGTLTSPGDPFELPHCPRNAAVRVVHDESPASFDVWKDLSPGSWGQVVWDALVGVEKTVVAVAFTSRDGRQLMRTTGQYDGERHGDDRDDRWTGIWWLWPSPIVLEPWQVPLSWGELRAAGTAIGVDVDARLREIARSIRGKNANILLLGYPIPRVRGEPPIEVHWQAVSLPKLETSGKPPKGFRRNDQGWWQRDRLGAFGEKRSLDYITTSNWHPDRLQARGRYAEPLRAIKIAVVGCGALGSILAELLVRGGVSDVLLIDHDALAVENLVRHTLCGRELGRNKASALRDKLTTVAPFASVRAHEDRLPTERAKLEELLDDRDIVVDCTAANDVLMVLGLGWWSMPRLFVSASVGYEAKRLFVFAHRGASFPYDAFRNQLDPLLAAERAHWSEKGETLEGAGCWSPLFPARMDDLMLAAASCTKVIEELTGDGSVEARLVIFEQCDAKAFGGFVRVTHKV